MQAAKDRANLPAAKANALQEMDELELKMRSVEAAEDTAESLRRQEVVL